MADVLKKNHSKWRNWRAWPPYSLIINDAQAGAIFRVVVIDKGYQLLVNLLCFTFAVRVSDITLRRSKEEIYRKQTLEARSWTEVSRVHLRDLASVHPVFDRPGTNIDCQRHGKGRGGKALGRGRKGKRSYRYQAFAVEVQREAAMLTKNVRSSLFVFPQNLEVAPSTTGRAQRTSLHVCFEARSFRSHRPLSSIHSPLLLRNCLQRLVKRMQRINSREISILITTKRKGNTPLTKQILKPSSFPFLSVLFFQHWPLRNYLSNKRLCHRRHLWVCHLW